MSFTTTTMCARRIWGSDPRRAVARAAGWRRADDLWESLTEAGQAAWAAGDTRRARRALRLAHWVSVLGLGRDDLRRATSLVNRALLDRNAGAEHRAQRRLAAARALWQAQAARAVQAMQIHPRARSSLFHLRMEALHRATYHDNMRLRIFRICEETAQAMAALADARAPGCRLYSRWRGERPMVHDDTRRVLSACLLILEDPVCQSSGRGMANVSVITE